MGTDTLPELDLIPACEIREGDTILASSARYHGPDVRVTAVEVHPLSLSTAYCLSFVVETPWGSQTRLNGVPLGKRYRVRRGRRN